MTLPGAPKEPWASRLQGLDAHPAEPGLSRRPRRKRAQAEASGEAGAGGPGGTCASRGGGKASSQPLWIRKEEGPWVSRPDEPQGAEAHRRPGFGTDQDDGPEPRQRASRLTSQEEGGPHGQEGTGGEGRPAFPGISAWEEGPTRRKGWPRAQGPQMRFSRKAGDRSSSQPIRARVIYGHSLSAQFGGSVLSDSLHAEDCSTQGSQWIPPLMELAQIHVH